MTDRPYTPETLAERWACTPDHIRRMCRRGDLTFFKIGSHIRIPFDEVERYEKEPPSATPTPTEEQQDKKAPSNRYVPRIVPGLFNRT
jgi:excisionase family DNA binding protein